VPGSEFRVRVNQNSGPELETKCVELCRDYITGCELVAPIPLSALLEVSDGECWCGVHGERKLGFESRPT